MSVRRNSRVVLLYVVVAVVQLAAVLMVGGGGLSVPGVLLAALLFGLLWRGRPAAWWILVAMNSAGLGVLLVSLGSHLVGSGRVLWLNVSLLLLTSLAMEGALLSPAMRRHVASRGWRVSPRPGP